MKKLRKFYSGRIRPWPTTYYGLGFLAFLSGIAAAVILCSNAGIAEENSNGVLKVKHYNTLGRTGLKVSDIGFGAGATVDPEVVEYALKRGINYFDTSEYYCSGKSEEAIGKVAAEHRKDMIICTKLGMDGETKKEDIVNGLEKSLKRLQTDYADILMIHGGNQDALANPRIFETFDELKKQKKIRFCGVSHHGPDIPGSLKSVIAENKVDVILCSYDPKGHSGLAEMIETAKQKGIGIVGMKVFNSAQKVELEEFKSGKYPFHLAALRWALKESNMDSLLLSMNVMEQIDEYIEVSGSFQ